MGTLWFRIGRIGGAGFLAWLVARVCYELHSNRAICSMALLLLVLGTATLGDWLLAILTSVFASLAFSWYFVDVIGSLKITTVQGGINFSMMLVTAMTGSQLAIRAQRRADEAVRRREEMEKLHRLGSALLASGNLAEAAENLVKRTVDLFGVTGARLRTDGVAGTVEAGSQIGPATVVQLGPGKGVFELFGPPPSSEVCNALTNLVNLGLDRARAAEDRARIDAAQRGEELRNTVLNALAHNFKTPLTSIKAAASLLRSQSDMSPADSRELVVVIDEEADRLGQLIRESLDVARIESRRADPKVVACSVSSIVSGVEARVSRYLGGRKLRVDVPEDLPSVSGDEFLFEQMLIQVVDNAWKYSKAGSSITIGAEWNGKGEPVVVKVQNEGSFIPEDERERIFDKFYRGAASRSKVEGSGLGLAISRSIAEAHGGSMWLESHQAGPVFCFSLPVRTGEPASLNGNSSNGDLGKGGTSDSEWHHIVD